MFIPFLVDIGIRTPQQITQRCGAQPQAPSRVTRMEGVEMNPRALERYLEGSEPRRVVEECVEISVVIFTRTHTDTHIDNLFSITVGSLTL